MREATPALFNMTTETTDTLTESVTDIARKARAAALRLAAADTEAKNKALHAIAHKLIEGADRIVAANRKDVAAAEQKGLTKALIDRLTLTTERVKAMADGVQEIAHLPDPVGEVLREWTRPNGIHIKQVRVPLGVIGIIYESRPNVTVEAAALCLKAGNAVVLRGGSEAFESNRALVDIVAAGLAAAGLPNDAAQFLPPQDRRSTTVLTRLNGLVDLIIARGSEQMIKDVSAQASVPVLGHGKGVCHVYVDKAADVDKAVNIAFNAKVQRPGVCNAMETLLVHDYLMWDVLPKIANLYIKNGVEIRGDEKVRGLISQARAATDEDWDAEYLDKIVSIKVVDSLDDAIDHINRHGSGHTESIVTEDAKAAEAFQRTVDAACVMVNASTRLHDGGEFGFGSEIGISTQKLHARGTMGLRELTSTKFLVKGTGQIRE